MEAKETKSEPKVTPKKTISPGPLGYLTLNWITPILKKGKLHPLENDDLYELQQKDKAEAISVHFDPFWNEFKAYQANPNLPAPSFVKHMLIMILWPILGVNIFSALEILISIIQPKVLQQFLLFIEPGSQATILGNNGYYISILLFAMQFLQANFHSLSQTINRRVVQILRTAIVGAVYEKSLRLSPRARGTFSEGKIMNMVNQDINNILFAPQMFSMAWTVPLQLIMSLILLGGLIGASLWSSIAALVVIGGISMGVGPKIGHAFNGWFMGADDRIGTIREMLYGIKVIKYQAMEDFFRKKIAEKRLVQVLSLREVALFLGFVQGLGMVSPVILTVVTFTVYSLGTPLTSSVVFPSLTYFNALVNPLMILGMLMGELPTTIKSIQRVSEFLLAEEGSSTDDSPATEMDSKVAVQLENVTWRWEESKAEGEEDKKDQEKESADQKDEKEKEGKASDKENEADEEPNQEVDAFHLRDLTLSVDKGTLVGICGSIGSGKSTFFSGLIGDCRKVNGISTIFGKIAFCSQQPWILTGTVEKNITFNLPKDDKKLQRVIEVCGLASDLAMFSDGVNTKIGESGVNLSGGQKARISLARALYFDADIYLLDDPIAALDAQVGREVFSNAIQSYLADKTVFLITHQLHYMQQVERVLVFADGKIVEDGSFTELNGKEGGLLQEMLSKYRFDDEVEEVKEKSKKESDEDLDNDEEGVDIIEAEEKAEGSVKLHVYKRYLNAIGSIWIQLPIYITCTLTLLGMVGAPLWLARWTGDLDESKNTFYLWGYAIIGSFYAASQIIFLMCAIFASIRASNFFHDNAINGLLRAPLQFFEANPIGRIINRLSNDVQSLDLGLVSVVMSFLLSAFSVFTSVVMIVQANYYFILLFVALLAIFYSIFQLYQPGNRDIKRINSIMKSPLDSHVSETLAGVSTVRAFKSETSFIEKERILMDESQAPNYIYFSLQIWLQYRLSILSSLVTFSIVLFASISNDRTAAFSATIGLALTYSSLLSFNLSQFLLSLGNGEAEMNSVERLDYYGTKLPVEAPLECESDPAEDVWPTEGAIEIKNLELAYPSRPDYSVIKNLSLKINAGEKIGVVGRTGSGKSTLVTALFRIMEAKSGSILIDNLDISKIGLFTLRTRMQIIPQDPILFKGTIRSNLDYSSRFSDAQLWEALEYSGLKEFVKGLTGQLESAIEANGENLSVGQRQLICLSRSILLKPKVLIMDEATASVDGESDTLIQNAINEHFGGSTIISIAHRLNTIAEFDRILVLDDGNLAEFDTPFNLLSIPTSIFSELANASGPANAEVILELAKKHHEQKQSE
ncbi:P-loop containing nucleoside triphosphate hydrolase protein [Globomyces pollinis-pini]|nr:P-loop containing nucleoside triphosphate hydrolase protein [Globomyces pollinis-pini]